MRLNSAFAESCDHIFFFFFFYLLAFTRLRGDRFYHSETIFTVYILFCHCLLL